MAGAGAGFDVVVCSGGKDVGGETNVELVVVAVSPNRQLQALLTPVPPEQAER